MCLSQMAFSHVGSHSSDMSIRLISAEFSDNKANISLILSNQGNGPIMLESISTNIGDIDFSLHYPLMIKAKSEFNFTNSLSITVNSDSVIPQIFTLNFDFGEAGSGPITIIPTSYKE